MLFYKWFMEQCISFTGVLFKNHSMWRLSGFNNKHSSRCESAPKISNKLLLFLITFIYFILSHPLKKLMRVSPEVKGHGGQFLMKNSKWRVASTECKHVNVIAKQQHWFGKYWNQRCHEVVYLSLNTHTHTRSVCEYRFHSQLHKYRRPLSGMGQSSNDQTDSATLWLREWFPICPWISSTAPLTHIPYTDSHRHCCPLKVDQKTAGNYLIHERAAGFSPVIKGPSTTKKKWAVHRFQVEQINTATGGGGLLLCGELKPVVRAAQQNRINQISNFEATRGTTESCDAAAAAQGGSPATSDICND